MCPAPESFPILQSCDAQLAAGEDGEGQGTDALDAVVQQTQAIPRYARFHAAYADRLLTRSSAATRYFG